MKCYNHLRLDAVALCEDCGKGLCKTCSDRYSLTLCDNCNYSRAATNKNRAKNEIFSTIGIAILIGGGIYYFGNDQGEYKIPNAILLGILAMCIKSGWRTLSMITPQFFMILPLAGWIVYFAVKLALSLAIGLIATPYRLIKSMLMITKMNKVIRYTNKMRKENHQVATSVHIPRKKALLEV